MYAGQFVEGAPIHELFEHPRHPYMEGLLTAMPRMDNASGALESIPGAPPRVGAMPDGCRFHPRCPYAQDRCRTGGSPALDLLTPDHATRCLRHPELSLRGTR
jgi:peptide/nickel transport system ATP-binding protein